MAELTDLDFVRQMVPTARDADEPVLQALLESASKAIQKYCRRDFVSTTYDELYDGNDTTILQTNQYPIISVQSIRTDLDTALEVKNTSTTTNQQARVSVTSTGITLKRVASGTSTSNSITFAAQATMTAMATAITAVGNGWTARVPTTAYNLFPSADLLAPIGALNAWGAYASINFHSSELSGFEIHQNQGHLIKTDSDDDWLWNQGSRNYRVQYTAGYSTIPEDVQMATALLVSGYFAERGTNIFHSQETATKDSFFSVEATHGHLPARIQMLLRPYRNHRI